MCDKCKYSDMLTLIEEDDEYCTLEINTLNKKLEINTSHHYEYIKIKFCPFCGRGL